MSEPLPESTRAIVDEAIDEAAQSLFSAADVPLARTDEILALIQGRAVREVLEQRITQVVKFGHTRDGDASLPSGWLPNDAKNDLIGALDLINGGPDRRDLPRARKRIIRAAALCLAALDRLELDEVGR